MKLRTSKDHGDAREKSGGHLDLNFLRFSVCVEGRRNAKDVESRGDVDEDGCVREVFAQAHSAPFLLEKFEERGSGNASPAAKPKRDVSGVGSVWIESAIFEVACWFESLWIGINLRVVHHCPMPDMQRPSRKSRAAKTSK